MKQEGNEILFLKPVFKENIWGGQRLKEEFKYRIPSSHTGEAWVISAHPNGDCMIDGGEFEGMTLSRLYESRQDLFGNIKEDSFPLLVKIIDAKEDLSIQVHPDDHYAAVREKCSYGKTECWYVLDCKENATIIIGHRARTREEMQQMIMEDRWSDLIREVPVKKGDFFQINPGCLHAIKGGTILLETQQSCDITYRVYDYDRLNNGEKRELHLEQAMEVIQTPYIPDVINRKVKMGSGFRIETLIECSYYKVYKIDVDGELVMLQDSPFQNVSVIDGMGQINDTLIGKGSNFIIPSGFGNYKLSGKLSLIVSSVV